MKENFVQKLASFLSPILCFFVFSRKTEIKRKKKEEKERMRRMVGRIFRLS